MPAHVVMVQNESYSASSVSSAVQYLAEQSEPPLRSIVRRGARALIKVNMGCARVRSPEERFTTHPNVVEAMARLLKDCGAVVLIGDDVARVGKNVEGIWKKTGMWDVALRTGSILTDFVSVGAREVRGGLLYPRKYLVTNAYFEADIVINAANCRSHANIGMSGAVKNMFGCIVGTRKQLTHLLFPGSPSKFGRAIADIYRTIPADFTVLDLTTVLEGHGREEGIRPVGMILAGYDPIAIDAVAAEAIGYGTLPVWTTYHGHNMGFGCGDIGDIRITGVPGANFNRVQLKYPLFSEAPKLTTYGRITSLANNTVLRPRPAISAETCTRCGDCVQRCPVGCIEIKSSGVYSINASKCVDCGCCLKVCQEDAVSLRFGTIAKTIRAIAGSPCHVMMPTETSSVDPAPLRPPGFIRVQPAKRIE